MSNKQYVDQVLADANISSQTSKSNAKIEFLKKENVELKRIVFNKEIIIHKLSSNKYITKEIPKIDKTDCSTNKCEEYISLKMLQNAQIHQKKHYPSQKDSSQINKNENNINKQLTKIRHKKHKNYVQNKNLDRNKNQSKKEEHQDVHQ